jgi:hypothetical protein
MSFNQPTFAGADSLFQESHSSLGKIPTSIIITIWNQPISDIFYASTVAGNLPRGAVIAPFLGSSWNDATISAAYQVVYFTESSIALKKCFDINNPVSGLRGVPPRGVPASTPVALTPPVLIPTAPPIPTLDALPIGVPSSVTLTPAGSGLTDVNELGETQTSFVFPNNITLERSCPVYAFTQCSVESISAIGNANSFFQWCPDVGFVAYNKTVVTPPSKLEDRLQIVIPEKSLNVGPRMEANRTNVQALEALAMRNKPTFTKLMTNFSTLNSDVVRRAVRCSAG